MTEQVYNQPSLALNNKEQPASDVVLLNASSTNTATNLLTAAVSSMNQAESKTKRIRILRILAIKTAAILEWDLLKFEKE